jgi:hypothetical protein
MIQINENAEAVYQSFGLTEDQCNLLDSKIIDIFSKWQSLDRNCTIRTLLNDMMDLAKNGAEQVYIGFQFGRIQNEFLDGPKINLKDILSKS